MDLYTGKKINRPQLSEEDLNFLSAHTASDRDTLKLHFDNFTNKHPNGSINRKDFKVSISTQR